MEPPTAPARHVEIEIKLEADDTWQLPDLHAVPGVIAVSAPVVHQLDAVYFDTARLDLLGSRVTLRRRTGGSDAGWHLKLPGTAGSRTEVALGLDPGGPLPEEATIPAGLATLVAGITRGRDLRPVARLRTERTVLRVSDGSGAELLEVADDRVSAGSALPDDRRPDCWREVEIELVDGSAEDLRAAGQLLVAAGATPSRSASKLGRALAAAGRTPVPGPSGDVGRRSSAAQVVLASLDRQRRALLDAELGLRLEAPDAARAALAAARRLRSTVQVFGSLISDDCADTVRRRLRPMIKSLTDAVDLATCAEHITVGLLEEPVGLAGPAGVAAEELLADLRRPTQVRVARWLAGTGPASLFKALDRLVEHPAAETPGADRVLPPLVDARWDIAVRRASALRRQPDDLQAAARMVKACRTARHAAELAGIASGVDTVVFAAAVEQVEEMVQARLACLRTADLLLTLASAPMTTGASAFVWGRLHSFELATADGAADDIADAWGRAEDAAVRR